MLPLMLDAHSQSAHVVTVGIYSREDTSPRYTFSVEQQKGPLYDFHGAIGSCHERGINRPITAMCSSAD